MTSSSPIDVQSLARRARTGCRSSYAGLVRCYAGPLSDFLRARGTPRRELEDLVQESFTVAWEKIESYDGRRPFATWLFTLARRRAVDDWRKRRPELGEEAWFESAGDADDPLDELGRLEERNNLWGLAREVLSRDQFTALWLSYGEGLETVEIARILGRARPTVRVLLFRARGVLRERLESREALSDRCAQTLRRDPPSSQVYLGGNPL